MEKWLRFYGMDLKISYTETDNIDSKIVEIDKIEIGFDYYDDFTDAFFELSELLYEKSGKKTSLIDLLIEQL